MRFFFHDDLVLLPGKMLLHSVNRIGNKPFLLLIWMTLLLSCTDPKRMTQDITENIPPRDYLIMVNYELGMHCTGFDFSYCCVLPPYNSIQAQVVKTERNSQTPRLLGADSSNPEILLDGDKRFKLAYSHEDPAGIPNTYSAKKKLIYWGVDYKDAKLPDYEFNHLYIYDDLEGNNHAQTTENTKKQHVGTDIPIKLNRGPTGQHVGKGFLRYSGPTGTVVFTDSPVMENVPIQLTTPGIWEALGLPLTPFNDQFTALITLDEAMVQPYQKAVVTLVDAETENPVIDSSGQVVRFFGVNPIDVPNCARCHANKTANGDQYRKYQQEYQFWREIRGASEWYAQLKATAISILEIHDDHHGTDFLKAWPGGANTYTRLGRDSVLCSSCHADNIIGQLKSATVSNLNSNDIQKGHANLPEPEHLISPLSEAIHKVHQQRIPMPDANGNASGCQLCHPSHRSDQSLDNFPLTIDGVNRFAEGDIRDAKGCFSRRDVHANANRNSDGAETKNSLNAVGQFLLSEVMPNSKGVDKGLYCTNCHNRLSRELYKADHLEDAVLQTGKTIRNQSMSEISAALGINTEELIKTYINPKSPMAGKDYNSGVYQVWDRSGQKIADIARIKVNSKQQPVLTAADKDGDRSVIIVDTDPNGVDGMAVSYDAATHGRDYWLAAGEPHCADCHLPPFVESMGGGAFPVDQPGKYALMRHSKGHAKLSCQACHQSTHGLYPVNPEVDAVSYQQAALLNADNSHGPIKCGACHQVDSNGVPNNHPEVIPGYKENGYSYEQAVKLQHTLR